MPMLPPAALPCSSGTEAPAVGTPINRAEQSTRAPPLLPGLIAASVWMAEASSAVPASDGTRTVRPRALTIPVVTVLDSPSGAPSAMTGWPTDNRAEEPISMVCSDRATSTFRTARSVSGSRPVIRAGTVTPSSNTTPTCPSDPAGEIT
jgi:hypothetical protein